MTEPADRPASEQNPYAGRPEYLGDAESTTSTSVPVRGTGGRRAALLTGAAVLVVGMVGGGAYAVSQILAGGGPSPATAVPANALAYVSVDLDPSASQKVEAFRMLRRFPALEDQLGESRDDLRQWLFEAAAQEAGCSGLDFDADVEPWLANRVGFAAMPGSDDGVVGMAVLQVDGEDEARAGLATLEECSPDAREVGRAFVGDYLLLTETQQEADRLAAAAVESSLADDAAYQDRMDALGDAGIVSAYVSGDAPEQLAAGHDAPDAALEELEAFEGAAAVVRFDDGSVELEASASGLPDGLGGIEGGTQAGDLPASTMIAVATAVDEEWVDSLVEDLGSAMGTEGAESMVEQLEARTGLTLPEDLRTLLGDGVALAVDSTLDLDALSSRSPAALVGLPVGLRIEGDDEAVVQVIDKLRGAAGPLGQLLQVEQADGVVAVGGSSAYVEELAGDGSLGEAARFRDAVPEAEDATSVLFVDFDAGDWVDRLAEQSDAGVDVRANLEPLRTLGMSAAVDGDEARLLVRLSTD